MIITILYLIIIASIIITATIGIVLYRRYVADRPRRARNSVRRMQMACVAATGCAHVTAIRRTRFNADKHKGITIKKAAIAEAVIKTYTAIAGIGKSVEPPPEYRFQ